MSTKSISIVVPIYNEEENVTELHKEIITVCEKEQYTYEVIFIDDGSHEIGRASCRERVLSHV